MRSRARPCHAPPPHERSRGRPWHGRQRDHRRRGTRNFGSIRRFDVDRLRSHFSSVKTGLARDNFFPECFALDHGE